MSASGRGRRVIVLVIDACGVGALPDAEHYGDGGTNTLANVAKAVGGLDLPVLGALGLGAIVPSAGMAAAERPVLHGRLRPLGPGKDSIAGHWELMGVVLAQPQPTFPDGVPAHVVDLLRERTGHDLICNGVHNGIAAIDAFGEEHLRSGALILYTSQDSVLQFAAHVDRVTMDELYRACTLAREALSGDLAVGRVIARPFTGRPGDFQRTESRRDFALAPPARSYLQLIHDEGIAVHGVGKIADLFSFKGVSESHPGATNALALGSARALIDTLDRGLIFVNLIETDQVHGHRKQVAGFHQALREIDAEVGRWAEVLTDDDLLMITADHGVDPAHPGTDHTREYVPLLAGTGEMLRGSLARARPADQTAVYDGLFADVGASALHWLSGGSTDELPGQPLPL